MPIRYNEKLIIPAPFVSIDKSYDSIGDKHVGALYSINLSGKMLPCQGSPSSSGWHTSLSTSPDAEETNGEEDQRLGALLKKKELMSGLFATEGKKLEIIPVDNDESGATYFYPRVTSMSFPAGELISWFDFMDYNIVLEADSMIGPASLGDSSTVDINADSDNPDSKHSWFRTDDDETNLYLRDVGETWNIEFNEESEDIQPEHSFRLTHTMSATGKRHYDGDGLAREAWENAKLWVNDKLGFNSDFANLTQAFNLPSFYSGFNHGRTENTDAAGGTYEVVETWILSSGDVLEDFTVATRTSIDDAKTIVSIDGRITGMETRSTSDFFNVTTDRYTAANTKFTTLLSNDILFSRSETYSGISLNPVAADYQIQKSPTQGFVSYNYTYDDRPTNCITGALSESLEITDTNYDKTMDIFASIPILGRSEGPILQDMATTPQRRRAVSIELLMPIPTGCWLDVAGVSGMMLASPRAEVDTVITAFSGHLAHATEGPGADQIFVDQDEETWNPKTGRYSRNVSWVWQVCP